MREIVKKKMKNINEQSIQPLTLVYHCINTPTFHVFNFMFSVFHFLVFFGFLGGGGGGKFLPSFSISLKSTFDSIRSNWFTSASASASTKAEKKVEGGGKG